MKEYEIIRVDGAYISSGAIYALLPFLVLARDPGYTTYDVTKDAIGAFATLDDATRFIAACKWGVRDSK